MCSRISWQLLWEKIKAGTKFCWSNGEPEPTSAWEAALSWLLGVGEMGWAQIFHCSSAIISVLWEWQSSVLLRRWWVGSVLLTHSLSLPFKSRPPIAKMSPWWIDFELAYNWLFYSIILIFIFNCSLIEEYWMWIVSFLRDTYIEEWFGEHVTAYWWHSPSLMCF